MGDIQNDARHTYVV